MIAQIICFPCESWYPSTNGSYGCGSNNYTGGANRRFWSMFPLPGQAILGLPDFLSHQPKNPRSHASRSGRGELTPTAAVLPGAAGHGAAADRDRANAECSAGLFGGYPPPVGWFLKESHLFVIVCVCVFFWGGSIPPKKASRPIVGENFGPWTSDFGGDSCPPLRHRSNQLSSLFRSQPSLWGLPFW